MVCKLIIQDKEFDIEILDPKLQEIIAPKKTGYEIVELTESFYYVDTYGSVCGTTKINTNDDTALLVNSNCYRSREIAENNARADRLMRQLRRFAAENREHKLDWSDYGQAKYMITYRHETDRFFPEDVYVNQDFGAIYFDSAETACKAIDEFKEDLLWYFTEYKDRL